MDDIENVPHRLMQEINKNITVFSKMTDLDKKKKQAEMIKLLCESLGVFFNSMDLPPFDYLDDPSFYNDFQEENRKSKKAKKKKGSDIPF